MRRTGYKSTEKGPTRRKKNSTHFVRPLFRCPAGLFSGGSERAGAVHSLRADARGLPRHEPTGLGVGVRQILSDTAVTPPLEFVVVLIPCRKTGGVEEV